MCAQDEADAVPAVDKFFKNTWNAQRPTASKQAQQGMHQQSAANWQGSKPMHGYNSPILSIPPEQYAQYFHQYQQQRMLQQHLQQQQYQQQAQHAARHQQHPQPPDSGQASASVTTSIHPSAHPSVNLSQYHAQQQQQQQQQRSVALPSSNGNVMPPARVTSPFAPHAQTGSSHGIPQSSTAGPATTTPPPPAAGAEGTASNDADSDHLDIGEKAIDACLPPPPPDTFTGSQSAPDAPVRSPQEQAPDPSDPLPNATSARHSASQTPHAAAMQDATPAAERMPPAVSTPAADAITAAQGGLGQPGSSSGSLPQHGPVLGQPFVPMMMPSMGYPGQPYGMPMPHSPGNGREVYPYGGMMVPMMLGTMFPPPPQQQQQQQNRAGRGGRPNAGSGTPAGLF